MIYLVIPAYNEEENIGKLLSGIRGVFSSVSDELHMVLVNDGSIDRTAEVFAEHSRGMMATLLSHSPNRGVAEAFRRGFDHVLTEAQSGDLIVTLEADGTSDLAILETMTRKARNEADAVLASCYAEGGFVKGTNWIRILLSRIANFLIVSFFPMKGIHTYSSFYRVYRVSALADVRRLYGDYFREKGFVCVIELLIRLKQIGKTIKEVPMVLDTSHRIGKSKMNVPKTILGYFRLIGAYAFRSAPRRP